MTDDDNKIVTAPTLGRRQLLKRTAVALPVVATIPSGAAAQLARSSNLISGTMPADAMENGRLRCLDTQFTNGGPDGVVDLGPNGAPYVWEINADEYKYKASEDGDWVLPETICETGGQFRKYDLNGNFVGYTTNIPQPGIMVSATALSSFAGSITFDEI